MAVLPLLLIHALVRWPLTRPADRPGRRLVLLGLPGLAFALWIVGRRGRPLDRPAAGNPRFTGSVAATSLSRNDFPVTNWLLDDPDPLDPATWRLAVNGAVAAPQTLSTADLRPLVHRTVTLDCTSGWFTDQVWSGVPLADLLDRVESLPEAATVRCRSVTGHQVELPIAEARRCLVAGWVGGAARVHPHGGPYRLIVPDRRGVAWVKWLAALEVVEAAGFRRIEAGEGAPRALRSTLNSRHYYRL